MRQFFCFVLLGEEGFFVLVWVLVWAQIGKVENINGHSRKLGMPKPEIEKIKRILDQTDRCSACSSPLFPGPPELVLCFLSKLRKATTNPLELVETRLPLPSMFHNSKSLVNIWRLI